MRRITAPAVLKTVSGRFEWTAFDVLSYMNSQITRFRKNALQKSARLKLLGGIESFHGGRATDEVMKELSVSAEAIAVWEESECILPANKLSAHLQHWSVRVD